jgi:hypothetical protein
MFRPIPYPILTGDYRPLVRRAHQIRGAVFAGLVRDVVRWVSAAAR